MYAKYVVNPDITGSNFMVTETHSRGEYFVLVVGSAFEVMVTMRNIPWQSWLLRSAVAVCAASMATRGSALVDWLTAGDSSWVCVRMSK